VGSWWCRGDRGDRPTAGRRRRRAALVGSGALAGVRRRLGAGKYKQRLEKLPEVSERAMAAWWRLPTVTRSSPEEGIGRRRRRELGMGMARKISGAIGADMSC
jgi:hypothetical protein